MTLLEERQDGRARGPPTEGAAIARIMQPHARPGAGYPHVACASVCSPSTPCISLFVASCTACMLPAWTLIWPSGEEQDREQEGDTLACGGVHVMT